MTREQIGEFLHLLGAKPAPDQSRTGWVVASCPLAKWRHKGGKDSHPSFAVRVEPGDSFTNCFSCGFHGRQSDLVLEMHRLNKQDPKGSYEFAAALHLSVSAEEQAIIGHLDSPDFESVLAIEQLHVFSDDWLASFPPAWAIGWAREYLLFRGVAEPIASMLDIRADAAQGRVCFPVRDFQGRLCGLHGRAVHADTEPRYRMYTHKGHNNPQIWLGEHWIDQERPLLVVEGPFDLVSVLRVYRNVASPLFANPNTEKLLRMAPITEWVTLFDHGTGGDRGREKISKVMSAAAVTHLMPVSGKDAGEMAVEELVQVMKEAVPLDELLIV